MNERDFHDREWYRFSALVAQEVVHAAKKLGHRQQDVADAMGVTVTHMSALVNANRGPMTVGQLLAGCDLAKCEPGDVVARAYEQLNAERVEQSATAVALADRLPAVPRISRTMSEDDATVGLKAAQKVSPQSEFETQEQ